MNIKKLSILSICTIIVITIFMGCSSANVPMSLDSKWKQSNSNSEDSYQVATIKDNVITIYYESDNGNTQSLYWVGTVIPPKATEDPYIWDSVNDHEKTDKSLLGASSDTKTMTYEDGVLSYKVGLMGTTTTVKLEIQK